jgi:tRNA pseudouridine55 synthase
MMGIVPVWKPAGWSSRDAVNWVAKRVRPAKVGHCGTLDPLAEGVLLVAMGGATRLIDLVHQLPKTYLGTFRWGYRSPSLDLETPLDAIESPPLSRELLQGQLDYFLGKIQQRPPAYSAIKIDGQRAYLAARKGQEVEMPVRTVTIHSLKVGSIEPPYFQLEIDCSTGTYIRTLGSDLAKHAGSDAVMTALVRSSIGPIEASEARSPEQLESAEAIWASRIDLKRLMPDLTHTQLDKDQIASIHRGGLLEPTDQWPVDRMLAAWDVSGSLQSILAYRTDGRWGPKINFHSPIAQRGMEDC